jgi:nicotinic acid phosphoribosyltransferase
LRPKLSQSLGKPSGRIEVAAEVAGECRNRRTGLVRVDSGQVAKMVDKMAGRMADKTPSAR